MKKRTSLWLALVLGTTAVCLATGSCVVQDFIDSILGSMPAA